MALRRANIIGSGPNGLGAAITLARAGVEVTVFEANGTIGGAVSTAQITLPGFHHDLGSSAYPMGFVSPLFRSLPLASHGLRWIEPEIPLAHPLDGGRAAMVEHALAAMPTVLGEADGQAWQRLFAPLAAGWEALVPELLGPIIHLPKHPLGLARFGVDAVLPALHLARRRFRSDAAQALFAGCAAHSVMPLEAALSAAVGLVLGTAAHASGWPVVAGGAQALSDSLASCLRSLGGVLHTGVRVQSLASLPPADATFFDTSVPALLGIAGDRLAPGFRSTLAGYRAGAGAFKVDWALDGPIPWAAEACRRGATIHVGGTLEEIAAAEAEVFRGRHPRRPFVLLVQPSVCDPSRAPAGRHVAWGYCHVPNGSDVDCTEAIEAQVERFAPGFRQRILARHAWSPRALEAWNPNLRGGDLSGGAMTAKQMVLRPSVREYGTSDPTLYLVSASTPPGGGVHGMCGYHAARLALSRLGRP